MTPPTLLPAAPPAASMTFRAAKDLRLGTDGEALRYSLYGGDRLPGADPDAGAFQCVAQQSSTLPAMLLMGYTRPLSSLTVSSPSEAKYCSVAPTSKVRSAWAQKPLSSP